MERADDAALKDAPKALNRLSVDRADDVLMLGVVNSAVREFEANVSIANPLIGADQANLVAVKVNQNSLILLEVLGGMTFETQGSMPQNDFCPNTNPPNIQGMAVLP